MGELASVIVIVCLLITVAYLSTLKILNDEHCTTIIVGLLAYIGGRAHGAKTSDNTRQ
jgi:hypothetical protein